MLPMKTREGEIGGEDGRHVEVHDALDIPLYYLARRVAETGCEAHDEAQQGQPSKRAHHAGRPARRRPGAAPRAATLRTRAGQALGGRLRGFSTIGSPSRVAMSGTSQSEEARRRRVN